MRRRLRELGRRVARAWPAALEAAREATLRRELLLGARRAQIALALTVVVGLFVFPPLRDALTESVYPERRARGIFGLRQRARRDPRAETLGSWLTGLYWLGGLSTSGVLLVLHAPQVIARRPRKEEGREEEGREEEGREEEGRGEELAASRTGAPEDAPNDVALAETIAPTTPAARRSTTGTERTMAAETVSGGTRSAEAPPEAIGAGGRYRIDEEIGRGGMGVVYRGRDSVLDRAVALKELPRQLVRDATLAERFRTEARALARLTHPGVVQVFDLIESDDGMWMAMELVEGGSLDAVVDERAPLPFAEVSRLGVAMAEGLEHAHAQGVIHRDFKPHNVLLTADGRPKITDFGLAKIARQGPRLTQLGAVMGSPSYMSPEQAAGRDTDHRTDVYALGVTLYELLTGRCPFSGDTGAVLAAHLTQEPPSPAELSKDAPAEVCELLLRMLDKAPGDRPDLDRVADTLRRSAASR